MRNKIVASPDIETTTPDISMPRSFHKPVSELYGLRRVLPTAVVTGAQFLQSTTLHGFKYFRDPHIIERLFWMIVHTLNVCCASVLCLVLWQRFAQNPSILAVKPPRIEPSAPDPYPVITICPPHRITLEAATRFVRKLTLPAGLEESYLISIVPQLAIVLSPSFIHHRNQDLLMLDLVLSVNNLTYLDALTDLAQSCSDFLYRCFWYGENVSCSRMFNKVVARNGICCAFNRPIDRYLRRKTNLEFSVNFPAELLMVPSSEMSVILNFSRGVVRNPLVDCARFKIEDFSMNSRKTDYTAMLTGHEYWVETSRIRVNSADAVDDLAVKNCQRKDPERPHNTYLCQMKCIVHTMAARCGCIGPTYPQLGVAEPCLPSRAPCLHTILDDAVITNGSWCKCKATCDEARISSRVESMPLNALPFTLDSFYDGATDHMIILRVSLQNEHSRLYMLEPTVSWLTLLSSLGGIFNVFLGVGVVSVLEVLFYITMRLPINVLAIRNRRIDLTSK